MRRARRYKCVTMKRDGSGATPRYRRKTVLDPTLARPPLAANLAQVAATGASEAGGCV